MSERNEQFQYSVKKKMSQGRSLANKNSTSTEISSTKKRPVRKRPVQLEKGETKSQRKSLESLDGTTKQINKKRKHKRVIRAEVEKKKIRKKYIIEIIKFILPIVLLALIIFFFILKTSPHMVDGESMNPTLKDKDRVIVWRTKEPKRYEIITFKPPVKSKFQYVKRVIGMPGDRIWIEKHHLFINHQVESLPEIPEIPSASELPDGTIKIDVSQVCLDQLADLEKIPQGYYFVLGDNRTNSSDSRVFGLVDGKAIEGVVSFRVTPFSHIGWVK